MFALTAPVNAGWRDVLNSATKAVAPTPLPGQNRQTSGNAGQALQNNQPTLGASGIVQSGGLVDLLMKKTGVSQTQAVGGAGALFQMAKSKMPSETFSRLEQSVPGIQELLGGVPVAQQPDALGGLSGRLSTITGGAGETVGSAVALASAFQQQGMSPQMVQQFIPIVVDFVKERGGEVVANSLAAIFAGH